MAIKGKRKPKGRTGRAIAAAPRPYLVPPRTPWYQRTSAKFVLVLLAEAVLFLFLAAADAQSDADRRREEIAEFTSLVEARIFAGGVATPSFGAPLVLPELGQTLTQLQAGQRFDREEVTGNAEGWAGSATAAADGIGAIETDNLPLKEARNQMEQGLLIFAEIADQITVAARLDEGNVRDDLVASIGEQSVVAAQVFDAGYGKLQEERRKAGLPVESVLPGAPGQFPAP